MRAATVALIVDSLNGKPNLVEALSDDREIAVFESAIGTGAEDPLESVREHRERRSLEEEEFAGYVEELLTQPFLRPEVRQHGVQWLKSKIRIEQYQKSETEAARIIAEYAFQIFSQEREKMDFFLAGPTAKVRIRVFVLNQGKQSQSFPDAA